MTKDEIAKHIFARNPSVNKLFITSDGQAFYEKHQAEGHSQRLKDQTVTPKARVVQEVKAKISAALASDEAKGFKVLETSKAPEATEAAPSETPVIAGEATPEATSEASQATPSQEADAKNIEVNKPEEVKDPFNVDFLSGNVKTVSEKVKTIEKASDLVQVSDAEKAGADRKTVHDAIADRFEELHKSNSQNQ